jgi:hypothetical protein
MHFNRTKIGRVVAVSTEKTARTDEARQAPTVGDNRPAFFQKRT